MPFTKSFASDNNAPVHPSVFQAMLEANRGDVIAYGDDPYTREAEKKFREAFGPDVQVFFVFNGTGANVSALSQLTRPYQAVICAESAHIHNDECGAPEKFTGCKVHVLHTTNGKITADQVKPLMHSVGFEHHAQPKVISITQATELGTVYTREEIMDIARFAHGNDLYLHMDGARIANAAAAQGLSFRELVTDTGVDVLSFGGTKNGIMLGEAVVFLNSRLAREYQYVRKQSMQLASKMRYISAQFSALFTNDLWLKNATHSNKMAQLLAEKVREIPQIRITQPVETNGVFAIMPKEAIEKLQQKYFFYVWNETRSEVRWMTSFATTEKDVENFVDELRKVL